MASGRPGWHFEPNRSDKIETEKERKRENLQADQQMCYKVIHNQICVLNDDFFGVCCCTSTTRGHCYKLYKGYSQVNTHKYFFANRICDIWNALLVEASILTVFKRLLDNVDLTRYFIDIDSCMELLNVFFFFLTTVCVKLLGLYLPLYMFCCMRASVSGLMALLVLWFFPLNIFIHSFIHVHKQC